MSFNRLLLFTKYPTPGCVKSRLIPLLGTFKSALFHKMLSEMAINTVFSAKTILDFILEVYYSGADSSQMSKWLGNSINFSEQAKGDLGYKMREAFRKAFYDGARKVVIVGSDVPDLSPRLIFQAFNLLRSNNMVIGPTYDGGYYLLGCCDYYPFLFDQIEWSAPTVLNQTLDRITKLALDVLFLPLLRDIDTPEDFIAFQNLPRFPGFA